MKIHLFQSCGQCCIFQICWYSECSILTASYFRIWNSSARIRSPPLALFVVMLPKAHLSLHSKMSSSRLVITPLWLSGSLRSFLYSSSSLVAQLVKNLPAMWETWVWSLVGKIPWRRVWLLTPVFWRGEFHGVFNPWVCKESDMTERLSLHCVVLPRLNISNFLEEISSLSYYIEKGDTITNWPCSWFKNLEITKYQIVMFLFMWMWNYAIIILWISEMWIGKYLMKNSSESQILTFTIIHSDAFDFFMCYSSCHLSFVSPQHLQNYH